MDLCQVFEQQLVEYYMGIRAYRFIFTSAWRIVLAVSMTFKSQVKAIFKIVMNLAISLARPQVVIRSRGSRWDCDLIMTKLECHVQAPSLINALPRESHKKLIAGTVRRSKHSRLIFESSNNAAQAQSKGF